MRITPTPALQTGDATLEGGLPDVDLRALARRAALPAALAVVAGVAFVVAGGPLQAFADALDRALDADPRWVGAAVVFELLSFAGYVALLWLVGRRATRRLGLRESAEVSLGGAAATRLLPAGGVGGVALTIWAFRRAGLDGRAATRTLLAFLFVLYSVFLTSIAVAGGLLALGLAPGDGPLALSAIPAIGAVLVIGGALALAAYRPSSEGRVASALPGASGLARAQAALKHAPADAGDAVRDAVALVRSGDPRLLGALAWWAFDAAVLWGMLHALGAPPSLAVVVLAYFVGQVANTIPIPGATSGGIVGVLLAFGVEADLALASVLAYRSVAIWLPAPFGLVALGGLRRTFARWAEEDAPVWHRRAAAIEVPA
jgi:putative heme transporter